VRKVIILDSCHSGGFLTNDSNDLPDFDFETLHNFAFLAAAAEDRDAFPCLLPDCALNDGSGIFTNTILPLLNPDTSFAQLRSLAATEYSDTVTGFFKEIGFGTESVQLYAFASPDFDTSLPLLSHLPGDYNLSGVVDAADYAVWRSGLGENFTQSDYDVWRANFGRTTTDTSLSANTIAPEPSTYLMLAVVYVSMGLQDRLFGTRKRR
jgi:hypothetical protein